MSNNPDITISYVQTAQLIGLLSDLIHILRTDAESSLPSVSPKILKGLQKAIKLRRELEDLFLAA